MKKEISVKAKEGKIVISGNGQYKVIKAVVFSYKEAHVLMNVASKK